MDDDDVPEIGDLGGLARLVRRATNCINARTDLDDTELRAWIAEIDAAFERATAPITRH